MRLRVRVRPVAFREVASGVGGLGVVACVLTGLGHWDDVVERRYHGMRVAEGGVDWLTAESAAPSVALEYFPCVEAITAGGSSL